MSEIFLGGLALGYVTKILVDKLPDLVVKAQESRDTFYRWRKDRTRPTVEAVVAFGDESRALVEGLLKLKNPADELDKEFWRRFDRHSRTYAAYAGPTFAQQHNASRAFGLLCACRNARFNANNPNIALWLKSTPSGQTTQAWDLECAIGWVAYMLEFQRRVMERLLHDVSKAEFDALVEEASITFERLAPGGPHHDLIRRARAALQPSASI